MPVLPDSPECAALRANMEGFQHTHKDKSINAHGIIEGKSVIAQDRSCYLDKH